MMRVLSGEEHLRDLFAALLENTFHAEIGVADTNLVDYLTELMLRFVRSEAIFKVRDFTGNRLEQVGQMMAIAEDCPERPRREIHRHIGDFTLFWTGVYPEALKHLKGPDQVDCLVDYQQQGKRSYFIASTYEQEPYQEESTVLRTLSDEFDLCCYGLRCIRKEWEQFPSSGYAAGMN